MNFWWAGDNGYSSLLIVRRVLGDAYATLLDLSDFKIPWLGLTYW